VKLAIALMVIGVLLFLEGISRMYIGTVIYENFLYVLGGFLTGLLLGSFLFYRGIKRYQRFKTHKS